MICILHTGANAMTSTKRAKTVDPKKKSQPQLTEDEQQKLLDQTNQVRERRAECQLDLAKLFLTRGKRDIALRRLREIVAEYGGSATGKEAKAIMKRL